MNAKLYFSILFLLNSCLASSMEKSASAMPSSDQIETLKQNIIKADLAWSQYYKKRDNLYIKKDYLERQLLKASDPCELDEQIRSDPRISKLEKEIQEASELCEKAFLDREYWQTQLRIAEHDINPRYFMPARFDKRSPNSGHWGL